jgi:ABC-type transport system involved in cytochrome c biogenesis permease component
MPSPSDLLWWQWVLCALGAGFVAAIFAFIADKKDSCLCAIIACIAWIAAALSAIIGIVRLVKWIWEA